MTLYKTVNGNRLAMSVDEEAAFLAEQPTIEQREALAVKEHETACKAECHRRINEHVDDYAQANTSAVANVINSKNKSELSADEIARDEVFMATYASGVKWIADTRAVCRQFIADGFEDYEDDKYWPECPAEVKALAKEY